MAAEDVAGDAGGRAVVRTSRRAALTAWIVFRRYPLIPALIILLLLLVAIFGPMLEPYPPRETSLRDRNLPPFWGAQGSMRHILGTDYVGRDILSRLIRAARVTVVVVVTAVVCGATIGTALGLITGYFGGLIDEVVMRLVDMWIIIPQLLIILMVVVVFGPSFGLLILCLAMLAWTGPVRLVRAETLSLRTLDYVTAARVAGASPWRIIYRHILPGVMNVVVVSTTLQLGGMILTEATLSFLGAGVPAPNPSWGNMVAEGRAYLSNAWWIAFLPGVCIALVVFAGNFLGDWLRDRWDPTLRQI